ncbi:MAG: hypothetical protein ACFFAN_20765 [Promethearchaeota archaeon]
MGVGKGGNFKGGIELSYTHSLVQSFEVKYPAPVVFINFPTTVLMPRIVRGHKLIRSRWSSPLLPEEKEDQLQMILMKGTIGVGNDYDVFIGKKKIARVDHQRITKDVEIEIYDEDYAKDKMFVMTVALFGCLCFFMKEIKKVINGYYKKMKVTGTSEYKPPRMELDLFKNPRMIRR